MAIPKLSTIRLERVHYVPKALEPGVLYVSTEFGAAVHLCACGCGSKVSTPLGPTEWAMQETTNGPSLTPSVGNWQLPCKSHYWIRDGKILWAAEWATKEIKAGRRAEEKRRRAYFAARDWKTRGIFRRAWAWLKGLMK